MTLPLSDGAEGRRKPGRKPRTALPAATKLLGQARPLVRILLPIASDLVPAVRYLTSQRDQIAAAQANVPAAVNATAPSPGAAKPIPYLRAITYFSPEGFVGFPKRFRDNRRNAYLANRGLEDLKPGSAIKSSDCDNKSNPQPIPYPESPPPCIVQGPSAAEFGGGRFPHLTRDPAP